MNSAMRLLHKKRPERIRIVLGLGGGSCEPALTIKKHLLNSVACKPTLFTTRAAIGTAETPAAPISGLMSSFENLFSNLAISTPAPVPIIR